MKDTKPAVADGMVVTFDFTLRLNDDEVADTTQGQMPLRFVVGQGQLLPALEDAMIGMVAGEQRQITIEPVDAYGEWDEDALEEVAISELPDGAELEEGAALEVTDSEGETYEATVYEINKDTVVLDYNHPLAGETLQFDVKVVDIRPATASELAHGHVHSGDGHVH
jgi:FKBP-type peptidyl-prolyl cis-trans isomerase SlyD